MRRVAAPRCASRSSSRSDKSDNDDDDFHTVCSCCGMRDEWGRERVHYLYEGPKGVRFVDG